MGTSVFDRPDSWKISVLQAGQWEHQCFTGWTVGTSVFYRLHSENISVLQAGQ